MKLLVDTQLLLWAAALPERLPQGALSALESSANMLFYSAASLWEVAIKSSLGRSDFVVDPHLLRRGLIDNGWQELSIDGSHAVAVASLPPVHKDPFDRILVAQAQVEGFLLITTDAGLKSYPGPIQVV